MKTLLTLYLGAFIFGMLAPMPATGQNVQDILELDTIIFTNTPATSDQVHGQYICSQSGDNALLYIAPYKAEQQLDLHFFNIHTKVYKSISVSVSEDIFKELTRKRQSLSCIAFSDQRLVLLYDNFFLIYELNLNEGKLQYIERIDYKLGAKFVKFVSEDALLFGDCYDYHPLDKREKTTLQVYHISKHSWSKVIQPEFRDIEFTYFEPNKWIDATTGKIAFAQTSDYRISIFDASLHLQSVIQRTVPGWKRMDTMILQRLRKKISITNGGLMIDSLSLYTDGKISRLVHTAFLSPNRLAVVYYMFHDDVKRNRYYIDIWNIDSETPSILHSGLADLFSPNMDEIKNKQNYEFHIWNNPTVACENYFVQFRSLGKINYLGESKRTIINRENEYLKQGDPVLGILVYKFK